MFFEVEIYSKTNNFIRIADNGFGMTQLELKNNWLTIGFSAKKKSKTSELGRRKTGESQGKKEDSNKNIKHRGVLMFYFRLGFIGYMAAPQGLRSR